MLTIHRVIRIINGTQLIEGAIKSTDEKPADYANGSILLEVDTGYFYVYDAEAETWTQMLTIKE